MYLPHEQQLRPSKQLYTRVTLVASSQASLLNVLFQICSENSSNILNFLQSCSKYQKYVKDGLTMFF